MNLVPAVVQWVQNPSLSLQWVRLLLWHGFDPWPRHFCMSRVWPKQKQTNQTKPKPTTVQAQIPEIPIQVV